MQCATSSKIFTSTAPVGIQETISSVFRPMVLAGPDAMGAPTKDLSWLSANVVFANSRIQPIFKSTSLPSAVIWAKEILLLRTAFNFQNRLSRYGRLSRIMNLSNFLSVFPLSLLFFFLYIFSLSRLIQSRNVPRLYHTKFSSYLTHDLSILAVHGLILVSKQGSPCNRSRTIFLFHYWVYIVGRYHGLQSPAVIIRWNLNFFYIFVSRGVIKGNDGGDSVSEFLGFLVLSDLH